MIADRLAACVRGRRAAALALLLAVLGIALHLEVSLWLVRPRAPWWEGGGPWALRDAMPGLALLAGLAGCAWAFRTARAIPDPARRLAWCGQLLTWAAAFWAVDRWLTFTLAELAHQPQYALLALLMARALDPGRQTWPRARLMLLGTAVGAVDEVFQYLWITASYSHYLDFNDILVNALATWLGLMLHYGAAAPPPARPLRCRDGLAGLAGLGLLVLVLGLAAADGRLLVRPAQGEAPPGGRMLDAGGRTVLVLERHAGFHGHWRPAVRQPRHWVLPPGLGLALTGLVIVLAAWPGPRRPEAWDAALGGFGAGVGWAVGLAARGGADHPRCPGDEQAWVQIHTALSQGVDWPVSGPLHVALVQGLQALGLSASAALAWLGVASTALAGAAWPLLMRRAGWGSASGAVVLLLGSSHFWASWLESRPQQLGQLAVAWALIEALRRLQAGRPAGLALVLGLTAIAAWHLLSFGLLMLGLTGLVLGWNLWGGRQRGAGLGSWWAAALPGLLLMAWPGGPYAAMLQDLAGAHLPAPGSRLMILGGAGLGMALAWWGTGAGAAGRGRAVLAWGHARSTGPGAARMAVVLAAGGGGVILAQAALLPAEAWQPYAGSPLRLLMAQLGNLLGLAALTGAAWWALRSPQALDLQAARLPLAWALAAVATLGAALLASVFMLHSNWLLRAWAYVLPWLAPAGGWAVMAAWRRAPAITALAMLTAWASAVLATLRPAAWLGC